MSELDTLRDTARAWRQLPPPELRRAIRRAAGLSQADLARSIGVTRQAISWWESDRRRPRGDLLRTYVAALQMLRKESDA